MTTDQIVVRADKARRMVRDDMPVFEDVAAYLRAQWLAETEYDPTRAQFNAGRLKGVLDFLEELSHYHDDLLNGAIGPAEARESDKTSMRKDVGVARSAPHAI